MTVSQLTCVIMMLYCPAQRLAKTKSPFWSVMICCPVSRIKIVAAGNFSFVSASSTCPESRRLQVCAQADVAAENSKPIIKMNFNVVYFIDPGIDERDGVVAFNNKYLLATKMPDDLNN